MQGAREKLEAALRRVTAARKGSPRARRVSLGAAFAVFIGATAIAVRALPPIPAHDRHPSLLVLVALCSVASVFVTGAEYALSAQSLGRRIGIREASRVCVLASAANLLPIPGAALIKTRALQRGGARLVAAASLTIAIGLVWLGVGAAFAGALLVTTAHRATLGVILAAAGAAVILVGVLLYWGQKTELTTLGWLFRTFAIEIASVGLTALRFFLVLRAIGFKTSIAQGATLAATAIVSNAAGIFPGGLGLREVLSAAIGPAVGLSRAEATVGSAVERIVSLLVLMVIALAILFANRAKNDRGTDELETCDVATDQ